MKKNCQSFMMFTIKQRKQKKQIKSKKTYGIKRERFHEVFYTKTYAKKTSDSRKAAVEHSFKADSWAGQKLLMFQGLN